MRALEFYTKKTLGGFDNGAERKLQQALDYTPLAISQEAAYDNQRTPRIIVFEYPEMGRKSDKSKTSLLEKDVMDEYRNGSTINSVL